MRDFGADLAGFGRISLKRCRSRDLRPFCECSSGRPFLPESVVVTLRPNPADSPDTVGTSFWETKSKAAGLGQTTAQPYGT